MELKLMEWNINQRLNYSGRNMPTWIADVIADRKADIAALTEVYKHNNWNEIKKAAFQANFEVFETSNNSSRQNDVVIAVNLNKLDVISVKQYYPSAAGIPDYLEVKCRSKDTGKEFVFICMRIHSSAKDAAKRAELELVMSFVKKESTVIICGDFNNYKRGCPPREWCLPELSRICKENEFAVMTPDGSSIFEEKPGDFKNEFPEDHFLIKGILAADFDLLPYNRDFTKKNSSVYKWERDFQKYMGKDIRGNSIYDSVPPPFPDHAILEGKVRI